jgi:hypothetical protein
MYYNRIKSGVGMKKLCVLLNFMGCISSSFAANSPAQSHYDDCHRRIPGDRPTAVVVVSMPSDTNVDISAAESVRAWLGALMTPNGSPSATSPTAVGSPTSAQVVEPLLPFDGQQTPNNTPQHQPARANAAVSKHDNYPELRLFYNEIKANNPITSAQLQENYNALKAGERFMATFEPNINLNQGQDDANAGMSYFDTFEWLANVRAWLKWWLNPWAWWNPSAYLIDENDLVEWDGNPPIISRSQE